MRFIPWDDDLAKEVSKNYEALGKTYTNRITGHVAEALVQKYYNQPINIKPTSSDTGWDLFINGATADVKNHTSEVCWFGCSTHEWTVHCHHGLQAEVYLFVSTDPVNKKLALIGWLTPEEIVERGKFIKRGELVLGRPCNVDCYRVKASDLWPID